MGVEGLWWWRRGGQGKVDRGGKERVWYPPPAPQKLYQTSFAKERKQRIGINEFSVAPEYPFGDMNNDISVVISY